MKKARRMTKASFPLHGALLAFSLVWSIPAEPSAQKPAGARIVLPETRKDAGSIPKGEVLRASFAVRNEGNADLAISDVRASCGCTVSRFDRVIRPGTEGKIELAIETRTFQGPISKSVMVVSNDPASPQSSLTVTAIVKPYADASSPGFLRIQTLVGEPASVCLVLFSDDPAFKPERAEVPVDGSLKAEIQPALESERVPGKNSNQWRLSLSTSASSPEGILGGAVKVSTGIAKQPEMEIPIAGFIRPTLSVSASYINFGNFEFKGQLVQREVMLTNNDPKNGGFTVSRADITGADAKAEIVRVDANKVRVVVTMNPKQKKGEFEGTLKISTNDRAKSEIRLPFQGMVF
jgi:hypothetical protein